MKDDFEYLAPSGAVPSGSEISDKIRVLTQADNIPFVKTIGDCLQAERDGLEGVIWDAKDYDQLEELIPKKPVYGWMLVSINIPVYFHITDIQQLNELQNVAISGLFSEDPKILMDSEKKVETLLSE